MPILFLIGWAIYLICHFNADAMTVEQYKDYDRKIDISVKEEIKEYVCERVDCPEHVHLDNAQLRGNKGFHVSILYSF